MFKCKIIDFFFFIVPLKRWRDFLIRHHIQRCSVCQNKMATSEEAKSLLIDESEVENLDGLWLALKGKLSEENEEKFPLRRRWKLSYGAACALAFIVVGIWLFSTFVLNRGPSEENLVEQFKINYIKIENEPARAYIFRLQDSKMIIIWAEKNT